LAGLFPVGCVLSEKSDAGWRFGPKIVVPMVTASLIAILIAIFGLYWATSRSDAVSVERQMRTTQRAIDDIVARLAQEQESIAIWDEPVERLSAGRPDWDWFDANIGHWLYEAYGHDLVFILDPSGRAIYGAAAGARIPPGAFADLREEVTPMIAVVRGRADEQTNRFDRPPGREAGAEALTTSAAVHDTHLLRIAGRPAAASVMQMNHMSRPLPDGSEPLLVSVRFLGGGFLTELERRNLIDAPRFSEIAAVGPGEEVLPLTDDADRIVTYFHWRPELPGTTILKALGPVVAFLILAVLSIKLLLGLQLHHSTCELRHAILQLRASEAQAQHLAFHDPLTGLPNRSLFNDRLDHALARARRGGSLALLMLDLDRFKHVNDTLGHLAGDALIREFGRRVTALVRQGDTVARLGGDEFAILLPDLVRRQDAEELCTRIIGAVAAPFEVVGNSAFVGTSIGIVIAPEAGLDRVELIRKADIALYRAKDDGRDCYRLFDESMDERVRFRSEIEEDLREALRTGEDLFLHYQPEVGADGRTIVGLEALVRWNHPARGAIPPEQFVPIAEETGLICQLGEWVLREACSAARRWPNLFIAVNLSPVQLRACSFADRAIEIVREEGVKPQQIELEVTEGVLLGDDALVHGALAKLRADGMRVALDDFGTGYSSFSYLRRFEVDKIKIDRSFVQHLGHRVDSASLISAVVTIGHAMGLTVTAEGVETDEQRRFLSVAGCNQMQGFLFSRAVSEDEVARLLAAAPDRREAA